MSQALARKISFSWEKKPGISKESFSTHGENIIIQREKDLLAKLPPPPSSLDGSTTPRNLVHDFQIPLPPCAFQPPYYRTCSKKGLDDDPFLAAYKEYTKSKKSGKRDKKLSKGGGGSFCEFRSFFSCKRSCHVYDNNLGRISHQSPQNID